MNQSDKELRFDSNAVDRTKTILRTQKFQTASYFREEIALGGPKQAQLVAGSHGVLFILLQNLTP